MSNKCYDCGRDHDEIKHLITAVKRLPKYPYHTWEGRAGRRSGESQQLVGIEDVLELLKRQESRYA